MAKKDLQKRIHELAAELTRLREMAKLAADIQEPVSTVNALEAGICIKCREPLGDERPARGCHGKCSQAIRRAIAKGEFTDDEAVENGLWAAPRISGRPANKVVIARSLESPVDTDDSDHEESPGKPISRPARAKKKTRQPPATEKPADAGEASETKQTTKRRKSG